MNDIDASEAHDGETAILFNICKFVPNQAQGVIESEVDSPRRSFPLREMAPPGNNNYLKAVAYALAVGDHLFVIQKASLSVTHFETYLSWLLSHPSPILSENQGVQLQVEFRRDLISGDLGEGSKFSVGGQVVDPDALAGVDDGDEEKKPEGGTEEREVTEQRRVGQGRVWTPEQVWNIMQLVMGGGVEIEEVRQRYDELRRADPNASLSVEVGFNVTSKKRGSGSVAAKNALARQLKTGLSDFPHGMVRALGSNFRQTGDDVRLSAKRRFVLADDNSPFLVLSSAKEQLLDVYKEFKEDGKIPDEIDDAE
ncbi:hypothetical protein [Caenispirillum salinarum]|uniref:hypothetical protein n=1 Tax=Caenispirillum salinarum TaxID=859058 RepID=UPI003850E82B